MTAARRQGPDEVVIAPRLSTSEAAMVIASLETRARVYLQSADLLAAIMGVETEVVRRGRRSAQFCREIAARIDRLAQLMRSVRR
jgi:hypothetical protein